MYGMFMGARAFTGAGIGCWTVKRVTNMELMFEGAISFNEPIGKWKVTLVMNMRSMFDGATSFDQRLGARWSGSTALKRKMFGGDCPGSIEGMVKTYDGTPHRAGEQPDERRDEFDSDYFSDY